MTKLAPSTSLPSLTSSPILGDGNGSCVALALASSQLKISCSDVDLSVFAGRSSASMLQLLAFLRLLPIPVVSRANGKLGRARSS